MSYMEPPPTISGSRGDGFSSTWRHFVWRDGFKLSKPASTYESNEPSRKRHGERFFLGRRQA
jgi:hypothetical protein